MNTIIMNKEDYCLKDETININYNLNELVLTINGDVVINDLNNNKDLALKIILNDNSSLIYNRFNNSVSHSNITIMQHNNTSLNFNQSIISEIPCQYQVDINIIGNNNMANVNVYGVAINNGQLTLEATGNVNKNIMDNALLENVRILTLNDLENVIIPNLLVSSSEVVVNHNATISSLDPAYLFYLKSKGLSEETASKLIIKGFLFNKLNLSTEEKDNLKI